MCGRNVKQITVNVLLVLAFIGCMVLEGCASIPGTVPAQIVEQSASVDTSISQLQTAQGETSATVEQIDATQQEITTATKDSAPAVVALVTKQTAQIKKLKENRAVETTETTGIQSNWSLFKVSTNKVMISDSSAIAKKDAQLKLAHKWLLILGGLDILFLLGYAAILLIKFYFKK